MSEGRQGEFLFVDGWQPPESAADRPFTLDEEIAAVWHVPIGSRVEVVLRDHDLPGLAGWLEVAAAPDLPFNARKPLRLRIGHIEFTDRQIASWVLQ